MNTPLTKWYEQSLALVPKHYRQELREYLDPLVKHCRAKTRARYWMWLRQQLAKNQDLAEFYFEYLKESSLPIEYEEDLFQYEIRGDTAFIDLGNDRIWKVPADDLIWAKAIFPINVREVPPLEPPEKAELRNTKARLKQNRLGFNERHQLEKRRDVLEGKIKSGDITTMPRRFGIFKKIDGEYVSVARLYIRAGRNETVDALDGDLLNYGLVPTASVTQPIYFNNTAIVPGIANPQNPVRVDGDGCVPNLYIVQSAGNPYTTRHEVQEKFERKMLPAKYGDDGSLLTTVAMDSDGEMVQVEGTPVAANADLSKRTGVYGKVQDAGWFKPLSVDEAAEIGLSGLETPEYPKESEKTAEL